MELESKLTCTCVTPSTCFTAFPLWRNRQHSSYRSPEISDAKHSLLCEIAKQLSYPPSPQGRGVRPYCTTRRKDCQGSNIFVSVTKNHFISSSLRQTEPSHSLCRKRFFSFGPRKPLHPAQDRYPAPPQNKKRSKTLPGRRRWKSFGSPKIHEKRLSYRSGHYRLSAIASCWASSQITSAPCASNTCRGRNPQETPTP